MNRSDGRLPEQIRPISFELNIAPHASGSVLVLMGNTRVICGVMIEETVPRWMKEQNITGGWLTAELFDAAILEAAAKTARYRKRPNRRPQHGDSTFDWAVVASSCRS